MLGRLEKALTSYKAYNKMINIEKLLLPLYITKDRLLIKVRFWSKNVILLTINKKSAYNSSFLWLAKLPIYFISYSFEFIHFTKINFTVRFCWNYSSTNLSNILSVTQHRFNFGTKIFVNKCNDSEYLLIRA